MTKAKRKKDPPPGPRTREERAGKAYCDGNADALVLERRVSIADAWAAVGRWGPDQEAEAIAAFEKCVAGSGFVSATYRLVRMVRLGWTRALPDAAPE